MIVNIKYLIVSKNVFCFVDILLDKVISNFFEIEGMLNKIMR